jgi:hypothetical protein
MLRKPQAPAERHRGRSLQSGSVQPEWRTVCSTLLFLFGFEIDGEQVDLGGEDEIVLAEAADGMRGNFDGEIAVACQMQIRVMILFFRQAGDGIYELDGGIKVLKAPTLTQALRIFGQAPAWQLFDLSFHLLGPEGLDAAFAGLTFLFGEDGGTLRFHQEISEAAK